jgi:hypothetical protein
MKTGSISGVISVSGGTQLGGVITTMYLNGSSCHVGLTIICLGTGAGIDAVTVSTMEATSVKCSNLGGGTTKASRMSGCTGMFECTGMTSRMAEPTGIVEDCAEMAESS